MTLRAIVFDVYGTLLEVVPISDCGIRNAAWREVWRTMLPGCRVPEFGDFQAGCALRIEREHAAARSLGIAWPEIQWPDIAVAALPELRRLEPAARDLFLLRVAGLARSVRMPAAAAALLQLAGRSGLRLGLASNAQAYTFVELAEALAGHRLSFSIFHPDLCFWSFENGFSKPDPHVFRILSARLRTLGVGPGEVLMVGDRRDNDIEPARAAGWRTWHLHPDGDGGWSALLEWFAAMAPDFGGASVRCPALQVDPASIPN